MKFKNKVLALAALLSGMSFVLAEVPSLINYQARLTESNGAPVTGTKTVNLEIYDSAVNGNVLYTELIGPVVIAANGIYNFQFGASGTSNTLITEPLASTDGVAAAFQKILSNGPITANSLTVSDGVYSWSQVDGSSDDTAFGVAYSAGLRRVTVNYYNGAPSAGKAITASYRYGSNGVTGALASGAEHWIALSVDGVAQSERQRVLAVPFSITAGTALSLKPQIFSNVPFNFFANAVGEPVFTGNSASALTWRGLSMFLPQAVVGDGRGNGIVLTQPIPTNVKRLTNVKAVVEANSVSSTSFNGLPGGGFCILRIFTVDIDGKRLTLSETRIDGKNGTLQLSPNMIIESSRYQYYIELTAQTLSNGGNTPGAAKLVSCSISYEGFPVN